MVISNSLCPMYYLRFYLIAFLVSHCWMVYCLLQVGDFAILLKLVIKGPSPTSDLPLTGPQLYVDLLSSLLPKNLIQTSGTGTIFFFRFD